MNTHPNALKTESAQQTRNPPETKTETNPDWWTAEHASRWERLKRAFSYTLDYAKAGLSLLTHHAASAPQPAESPVSEEHEAPPSQQRASTPAAPLEPESDARYGFGAHHQFPHHAQWNHALEEELRSDYARMKTGRSWQDARASIRQGWHFAKQHRHS